LAFLGEIFHFFIEYVL